MESNPMWRMQNGGSAVTLWGGQLSIDSRMNRKHSVLLDLKWEFLELRLQHHPGQGASPLPQSLSLLDIAGWDPHRELSAVWRNVHFCCHRCRDHIM